MVRHAIVCSLQLIGHQTEWPSSGWPIQMALWETHSVVPIPKCLLLIRIVCYPTWKGLIEEVVNHRSLPNTNKEKRFMADNFILACQKLIFIPGCFQKYLTTSRLCPQLTWTNFLTDAAIGHADGGRGNDWGPPPTVLQTGAVLRDFSASTGWFQR